MSEPDIAQVQKEVLGSVDGGGKQEDENKNKRSNEGETIKEDKPETLVEDAKVELEQAKNLNKVVADSAAGATDHADITEEVQQLTANDAELENIPKGIIFEPESPEYYDEEDRQLEESRKRAAARVENLNATQNSKEKITQIPDESDKGTGVTTVTPDTDKPSQEFVANEENSQETVETIEKKPTNTTEQEPGAGDTAAQIYENLPDVNKTKSEENVEQSKDSQEGTQQDNRASTVEEIAPKEPTLPNNSDVPLDNATTPEEETPKNDDDVSEIETEPKTDVGGQEDISQKGVEEVINEQPSTTEKGTVMPGTPEENVVQEPKALEGEVFWHNGQKFDDPTVQKSPSDGTAENSPPEEEGPKPTEKEFDHYVDRRDEYRKYKYLVRNGEDIGKTVTEQDRKRLEELEKEMETLTNGVGFDNFEKKYSDDIYAVHKRQEARKRKEKDQKDRENIRANIDDIREQADRWGKSNTEKGDGEKMENPPQKPKQEDSGTQSENTESDTKPKEPIKGHEQNTQQESSKKVEKKPDDKEVKSPEASENNSQEKEKNSVDNETTKREFEHLKNMLEQNQKRFEKLEEKLTSIAEDLGRLSNKVTASSERAGASVRTNTPAEKPERQQSVNNDELSGLSEEGMNWKKKERQLKNQLYETNKAWAQNPSEQNYNAYIKTYNRLARHNTNAWHNDDLLNEGVYKPYETTDSRPEVENVNRSFLSGNVIFDLLSPDKIKPQEITDIAKTLIWERQKNPAVVGFQFAKNYEVNLWRMHSETRKAIEKKVLELGGNKYNMLESKQNRNNNQDSRKESSRNEYQRSNKYTRNEAYETEGQRQVSEKLEKTRKILKKTDEELKSRRDANRLTMDILEGLSQNDAYEIQREKYNIMGDHITELAQNLSKAGYYTGKDEKTGKYYVRKKTQPQGNTNKNA